MGLKVDIAGWRDLRLLVHRECVWATLAVEVASVGNEACTVFARTSGCLFTNPRAECVYVCVSLCASAVFIDNGGG